MPFDFVRLLLCYRVGEEREDGGRCVLDFKMNIIKVEVALRVMQF